MTVLKSKSFMAKNIEYEPQQLKVKIMSNVPTKSWQFFRDCVVHLGRSTITKLYDRKKKQLYRWSADPDTTDDTQRNPIDRLGRIFELLCELEHRDVALAGLRLLAEQVQCEVIDRSPTIPDKDTLEAECLDDYPAVVDFHNAMSDGDHSIEVQKYLDKAIHELKETFEKYLVSRKQ
jgi:hypothetical protein